jgi:tetratricopeptide (TPR) repeat protein
MDLEIRDQLIDLLVAEGRVDEAIQNKINLARANYQFADLDGARQVYQSTLRLVPESRQSKHWAFKILNELTDIDMQRLDWRSALGNLEQMRTLQPEDAGTRARIIDLNYRLGQTGTAIAEVDQYLKLVETRNNEKAAEEFLLAQIQDHPERVELRLKLVEYYRRKRNVRAMIEQLDALASAYADAGQPARAATMVEEIIRLNPPNRADYEAALRQLRRATAG